MVETLKTFKLTEEDKEFLLQHFPGFNFQDKLMRHQDLYVVKITREEQKLLVDQLSDLLTSIGLDANDEPNEIGLEIEHLIDIFNPYTKPKVSILRN